MVVRSQCNYDQDDWIKVASVKELMRHTDTSKTTSGGQITWPGQDILVPKDKNTIFQACDFIKVTLGEGDTFNWSFKSGPIFLFKGTLSSGSFRRELNQAKDGGLFGLFGSLIGIGCLIFCCYKFCGLMCHNRRQTSLEANLDFHAGAAIKEKATTVKV